MDAVTAGQMMTYGPAIECRTCGHVEIGDDPGAPCPPCEEQGYPAHDVRPVVLSGCTGRRGRQCRHEHHHDGYGLHVTPA